jgi:hypothetical protein
LSGRVCYVSSTDHGDRLASLRLIGARTEEIWRAPESEDPLSVMADVASAADWIGERVGGEGGAGEVSVLCIDVDGANCTWLTAPSTEASVVSAALAHAVEGESTRLSGAWASPSLAEASVEALATTAVATRPDRPATTIEKVTGKRSETAKAMPQRLAVLAVPDVSARLLLDALDDRAIGVHRVVSLWHAMAAAWDPAPRSKGAGDAVVVATASPVMAVAMVDPAGRLLWSWSRAGQLLAAGTMRLSQDRHEVGAGMVRIGRAEIGRLTTDWLSWSVQLGVVPSRIVCLTPNTGADEDDDDLTPAGLGTSLGAAWPGAAVDMAVDGDPIGTTLSRLVDVAGGPANDTRSTLTLLTHRPGRAHRQLYRWAAACLFAVSLGLAGVGWKALNTAAQSRTVGQQHRAAMVAQIEETARPSGDLQRKKAADQPRLFMEEQLASKRQASNPNLEPPKPILSELETLSYVLGTSEVEIDEISLLSSSALVWVRVPNTATAEMLKASLDAVADSHCEWIGEFTEQRTRNSANQTSYFLRGRWKTTQEAPRGATTAATGGRS